MKNYRATIVGFATLIVLLSAGAAQSLSGSNTVFSDDIAPGQVRGSDLAANSVYGSKILNGSVTGTDIRDNSVSSADVGLNTLTGADIRDGAVMREDLGLNAVSGVTRVSQFYGPVGAGVTSNYTVSCPADAPVVLGGGYEWGASTGFSASTSEPWAVADSPDGWLVTGTNGLPQPKNLYIMAICASNGLPAD